MQRKDDDIYLLNVLTYAIIKDTCLENLKLYLVNSKWKYLFRGWIIFPYHVNYVCRLVAIFDLVW